MNMFKNLYIKITNLSQHKHAKTCLALVSFSESSIFPIPPDAILIPMVFTQPKNWFSLATLTTIFSVLGGILGYYIGVYGYELAESWVLASHYQSDMNMAKDLFIEWGIWVIFIAGFSPIPYKIFTIAAGFMSLAFLPFVIASFLGRGARFYLVSFIIKMFGPDIRPSIEKNIERVGWAIVLALILIVFAVLYL